jgi:FkbM family methyltransferase
MDSIKAGMTVIDVGAHIGYFALLAAKLVGDEGCVCAVEPSIENLEFLRTNISNNGFCNIAVHPYAAGRDNRTRAFQLTGSSDSHGFYAHPNTATVKTVNVEQRQLDAIVNGRVDAIKIDVEGAELEVLEGMSGILNRNKNLILWAEWFPAGMRSAGREPTELPEALQRLGFTDISVIDEKARMVRTVADTNALLSAGTLSTDWYANIWARRNSQA